jgi:hypothetical protein
MGCRYRRGFPKTQIIARVYESRLNSNLSPPAVERVQQQLLQRPHPRLIFFHRPLLYDRRWGRFRAAGGRHWRSSAGPPCIEVLLCLLDNCCFNEFVGGGHIRTRKMGGFSKYFKGKIGGALPPRPIPPTNTSQIKAEFRPHPPANRFSHPFGRARPAVGGLCLWRSAGTRRLTTLG